MKKNRLYLLLFFLHVGFYCSGTTQIPDRLIVNGDTVYIYQLPLETCFDSINSPDFSKLTDCICSACWRGYQALWEIRDNKLYLNKIYSCCETTELLITENTILSLKGKMPKKVISLIENFKNQRIEYYELYDYLNEKSSRKRHKKKYGYLYIRTIEKEADKIKWYPKFEIDKFLPNSLENERGIANWFNGQIQYPSGSLIKEIQFSYHDQYEFIVCLKIENGIVVEKNKYSYQIEE